MVCTDIFMVGDISMEMQAITAAIIPQHPHMLSQVTGGTTRQRDMALIEVATVLGKFLAFSDDPACGGWRQQESAAKQPLWWEKTVDTISYDDDSRQNFLIKSEL